MAWEQYRTIARRQRVLMAALVGGIGLLFGCLLADLPGGVFPWIFWTVKLVQLLAVWGLASALELKHGAFWAAASMLSWPGMIVLLYVNGRATAALRKAGIQVGLLGAACPATPPGDWTPPAWRDASPHA